MRQEDFDAIADVIAHLINTAIEWEDGATVYDAFTEMFLSKYPDFNKEVFAERINQGVFESWRVD